MLHHSQYYVMRRRRRDKGRFSVRAVWVHPGEHGPAGDCSSSDDAATRTEALGEGAHGNRPGAPGAAAGAHPTTAAEAREVNHGGRGSSDVDGAAPDIEHRLSSVTEAGQDVEGRETGPPYHGSSPAFEAPGGSGPFQSSSDEHDSSTSAAASEGSSTWDSSSDDAVRPYFLPEDAVDSEADDATDAEDDGVDGPQTPSSRTVQDMTIFVPHCTAIFRSVEDLYGLLLLRGPGCLREDQYGTLREEFKISSPVALPSLTYARETLTSRAGAWMLPLQFFPMAAAGHVGHFPDTCILPSAHVRRDVAFEATFQNFLVAEQRPDEERVLQPEFIDSPMYKERSSVVMAGSTIRRFTLDGLDICLGDELHVKLPPPFQVLHTKVADAFFLSHESRMSSGSAQHAGDNVVVCDDEFGEASSNGSERGSILARHWLVSELPPLSWIPESEGAEAVDVLKLRVHRSAGHSVGGSSTTPDIAAADGSSPSARCGVSSFKDGEALLTVSLCLNSDDFEPRRGRSQSLGGVYMSYLTLMFEHRRSSHASRTICATPAGVDSDDVLRAITPDLVEGATSGCLCRRREGTPVRVMADVAMFVGDYLQVVKTSMLMGYGAKAPCPLCTYRFPGVPGSRFGLDGSSSDFGMARTTARTRSVCRAVRDALKVVHQD